MNTQWKEEDVRAAIVQSMRKGELPIDLIVHGLMLVQRGVVALETLASPKPETVFKSNP